MKHTTFGLFSDSQSAGEAIAELNSADYTDAVSLVVRKEDGETGETELKSEAIKKDVDPEAPLAGGLTGAALGAVSGLLAAAVPITIPAVGVLLASGPLAALIGAAIGAGGGALIGSLVELGLPDEKAKLFQHRLIEGDVLVAVTTDAKDELKAKNVLMQHGADEVVTLHTED
jgi:hypothetical protein